MYCNHSSTILYIIFYNSPDEEWYNHEILVCKNITESFTSFMLCFLNVLLVHVSNFEGVAGSEDFACATLPTTPLDFQAKV